MSPALGLEFFTTNTSWEVNWLVRRVQNKTEASLYDFLGLTLRSKISSGWEDGCVLPESSARCACILLSLKSVLKIGEAYQYCVCSIVSRSFATPWMWPAKPLCPWDFPGKNTGVGCHFLLQGIFLIQGLNQCLLGLLTGGFFTNCATWETVCYCKRPLLQKRSERL